MARERCLGLYLLCNSVETIFAVVNHLEWQSVEVLYTTRHFNWHFQAGEQKQMPARLSR